MKLVIAFLATALLAVSAQAYKEGTYNCRTKDGLYETVFKITTLNLNGVAVPFLDVTRITHKDPNDAHSEESVYKIKGVADQFLDNKGNETLAVAAVRVELQAGQPGCVKQ